MFIFSKKNSSIHTGNIPNENVIAVYFLYYYHLVVPCKCSVKLLSYLLILLCFYNCFVRSLGLNMTCDNRFFISCYSIKYYKAIILNVLYMRISFYFNWFSKMTFTNIKVDRKLCVTLVQCQHHIPEADKFIFEIMIWTFINTFFCFIYLLILLTRGDTENSIDRWRSDWKKIFWC